MSVVPDRSPRIVVGLVLALACVLAFGPGRAAAGDPGEPESVRFGVTEGSQLRKVFERELQLVTRAGRPRVEGRFGDFFSFSHELEIGNWRDAQRVTLIDEYGPLEDGVPESIVRTFERIEMEHSHEWSVPPIFGQASSGTVERSGRGELEGGRVIFRRARDEAEVPLGSHEAHYSAALAFDASGPGELEPPDESDERLAQLVAGCDLSGMLPWREVSVGDHWFTDVETFRELCWPGGDLGFLDLEGELLVVPVEERLGRELDGTLRVELARIQTLDGVRFAQLDFSGRLESAATFEYEWVFDVMGWTRRLKGPVGLELEATLSGDLWWNLDAGHLDSVNLASDVEVLQSMGGLDGEIRWDGHEWDAVAEVLGDHREWRGRLTVSARFERL